MSSGWDSSPLGVGNSAPSERSDLAGLTFVAYGLGESKSDELTVEAFNDSCPSILDYFINGLGYIGEPYSPNDIGTFYHNIPRVTDTNYSRFEYEAEDEDYWIGVSMAVSFTFFIGLSAFCAVVVHICLVRGNQWLYGLKGTSSWTYSTFGTYVDEQLAAETAREDRETQDRQRALQSAGTVRHKRETLRHLFVCGLPRAKEHDVTLGLGGFASVLSVAGTVLILVGLTTGWYGIVYALDDADTLDTTFIDIADKLVDIENHLVQIDEDIVELSENCPLWDGENDYYHDLMTELINDVDFIAETLYTMSDFVQLGIDVAYDYEDFLYAVPVLLFIDFSFFASLLFVLAYKAYLSSQSRDTMVQIEDTRSCVVRMYRCALLLPPATRAILKASICMFSWVVLGLLLAATITGSDYCDTADANTINFSYTFSKHMGESEETSSLVRSLFDFYSDCDWKDHYSQQNTTLHVIGTLARELPAAMAMLISLRGDIVQHTAMDVWTNCSSANLTASSSVVDSCCLIEDIYDNAKATLDDCCDALILSYCPTIQPIYAEFVHDDMCDGVITEGLGFVGIGLLLFNVALTLLVSTYADPIHTPLVETALPNVAESFEETRLGTPTDSSGFGTFGVPTKSKNILQ